ncbi:hypothetical protein KKB06_03395, partial [Patescibacteria group bacterium]|nr:hypothetical protein [Patescibacteria group bacterium]
YEAYPWMDAGFTITPITSVTAAFLGTADMNGVGVCGAADGIPAQGDEITSGAGTSGCSWPGLLVNSEELKSQFSKRKAFRTINSIEDDLYIYKAEGDSSVSVCFIPSSKATKIKWDATVGQLKALAVSSTGFPTQLTSCSGAGTGQFAAEPTWTSAQTSCFVCVPEE